MTTSTNQSALYAGTDYPNISSLGVVSGFVPGDTNSKTNRFVLTGGGIDYMLTNMCTNDVELTVYTCRARHDIPTGAYASLAAIAVQGFADAGSASNASHPAMTLFQSPTFTAQFKCLSVKKHLMHGGKTLTISHHQRRPININMEVVSPSTTSSSPYMLLRGAVLHFFKVLGRPALDSGDELAVLPSVKVTGVYNVRYNYKYTPDTNVSDNFTNGLSSLTGSAEHINPFLGSVQTNTTA